MKSLSCDSICAYIGSGSSMERCIGMCGVVGFSLMHPRSRGRRNRRRWERRPCHPRRTRGAATTPPSGLSGLPFWHRYFPSAPPPSNGDTQICTCALLAVFTVLVYYTHLNGKRRGCQETCRKLRGGSRAVPPARGGRYVRDPNPLLDTTRMLGEARRILDGVEATTLGASRRCSRRRPSRWRGRPES